MHIKEIRKVGAEIGCTGLIAQIVPNPYIRSPWSEQDPDVVWIAKKYDGFAEVFFVNTDECYRIQESV